MKKIITSLLIVLITISCSDDKNEDKKELAISTSIPMLQSPVGDSCAEPYLFTGLNGIVYL